jgi:hypothetical protein
VSGVAADRQNPVRPTHAFLEVAALELGHRSQQDVPDRMAAERAAGLGRGIGRRAGEAVLEDLADEVLRVGQRRQAAPDVADRRDPELLAQDAGRAAVVGDRHDRGEVARVLLEAAQDRGLAGAAADDDDARPAGERLPLVDQLDEAAPAPGRQERGGQGADRAIRPEHEQPEPDDADDQTAERIRQELERDRVEDGSGHASRLDVAGHLADDVGRPERQHEQTRERDEEPALDPDPGGQPAPEVRRGQPLALDRSSGVGAHASGRMRDRIRGVPALALGHVRSSSRWKMAIGPKSCSRSQSARASVNAIERW